MKSKDIQSVKVWDPVVRIFHWSLVILFFVALATAEEAEGVHVAAGYMIIGLVILRVIWGFIGPRHARFTDFVRGPRKVLGYLKGLANGRPTYFEGHNPAGGAMIVAILVTLLFVGFTGIKVLEGEAEEHSMNAKSTDSTFSLVTPAYADEGEYVYVADSSHDKMKGSDSHELYEEVHEVFVGFMIVFISLHVLAVLFTYFVYKENLIKAMITGRKPSRNLPH